MGLYNSMRKEKRWTCANALLVNHFRGLHCPLRLTHDPQTINHHMTMILAQLTLSAEALSHLRPNRAAGISATMASDIAGGPGPTPDPLWVEGGGIVVGGAGRHTRSIRGVDISVPTPCYAGSGPRPGNHVYRGRRRSRNSHCWPALLPLANVAEPTAPGTRSCSAARSIVHR